MDYQGTGFELDEIEVIDQAKLAFRYFTDNCGLSKKEKLEKMDKIEREVVFDYFTS